MHTPDLERTHGQMVQEYFVGRMREFAKRRRETLAAVKTRADAVKFVAATRRKLRKCVSLLQ